jgi:hypothetical protein
MFIFKFAGQTLNKRHFCSKIGDTAPLTELRGTQQNLIVARLFKGAFRSHLMTHVDRGAQLK